ncbi:hypothetical protein [Mycolicibacterium mengxianglii]|uniref:hypothetical protein n=1 Tax=Mycolicibacterium mengxianglii TaxID=2736649 RepID=UPI0018D0D49F|nr:hypothetical protein [Mycolicibacterium mengxianglii]
MRVLLAPLWLRALVWTALAAVIVQLISSLTTASDRGPMVLDWPWGTAIFVFLTITTGAFLTWRTDRGGDPYRPQLAGLSPAQRSAAVAATFGGPAPADPEVLVAALRLGQVYLEQAARYRTRAWLTAGALALACALALYTAADRGDGPAAACALLLLLLLPAALWWSRAQQRRADAQHRLLTAARHYQGQKRF